MISQKMPEPEKYYSAASVIREGFLGDWIKSRKGFVDLLRTEEAHKLFKPITKQGRYMTFKIQGQNIINVMQRIKDGELKL